MKATDSTNQFQPLMAPTSIRIVTKSGSKLKSTVNITETKTNETTEHMLYWRKDIGLNVNFIENIHIENEIILVMLFPPDFELKLEFSSVQSITDFHSLIESLISNVKYSNVKESILDSSSNSDVQPKSTTITKSSTSSNRTLNQQLPIEIAFLSEIAHQSTCAINFNEGSLILEPYFLKIGTLLLKSRFNKWAQYTKYVNHQSMINDRKRWRFHAVCNQGIDLQAWYHAVYYKEVYRPRGLFWYRDAVLPIYRNSYDLVDNTLSPMEEAALAHVLCSPETSYGDVAGQMFIVQSIVGNPHLFSMFQKLSAQGSTVIKFPKTGNPSKKLFRFSFVEGNIYLTWKGKFGNQGVDLADVDSVNTGLSTDTIKRAYEVAVSHGRDTPELVDLYLSIISGGKSIDLCLSSTDERNHWKELLDVLVMKEKGRLLDMDSLTIPNYSRLDNLNLSSATTAATAATAVDDDKYDENFEWLLWYSSLGEKVLPMSIRHNLYHASLSATAAGDSTAEQAEGGVSSADDTVDGLEDIQVNMMADPPLTESVSVDGDD